VLYSTKWNIFETNWSTFIQFSEDVVMKLTEANCIPVLPYDLYRCMFYGKQPTNLFLNRYLIDLFQTSAYINECYTTFNFKRILDPMSLYLSFDNW
jgi:hypothetical protein